MVKVKVYRCPGCGFEFVCSMSGCLSSKKNWKQLASLCCFKSGHDRSGLAKSGMKCNNFSNMEQEVTILYRLFQLYDIIISGAKNGK